MLKLYEKALNGMPALKGANSKKKRGNGIVASFGKPRVNSLSKQALLQAELLDKQAELDAMLHSASQ